SAEFKDLGVQITSSTIIGTTFGKDGHGHDAVYTVMRGKPAKLLSFDLQTGELIRSLPLDGANGAWNACTASDGSIYVGTDAKANNTCARFRSIQSATSSTPASRRTRT